MGPSPFSNVLRERRGLETRRNVVNCKEPTCHMNPGFLSMVLRGEKPPPRRPHLRRDPRKNAGGGPAHTRPEPRFRGSSFFRFHPPSLQGGPARTQLPARPGGSRSRFRRVSRVPRSVPASKCSLRSPWGIPTRPHARDHVAAAGSRPRARPAGAFVRSEVP